MAYTASPYQQAADALKSIIDTEWAPEGWTAIHDNLHPAVGQAGTRIGIAPEVDEARAGNMVQNDMSITVKFYRRWDADVDQNKKIDPREITGHAERFRHALLHSNPASTGSVWYFNLLRIRYPNDPTGNKTRFEADIVAYGNNTALVETTG
jgi:hypothetical protein